MSSGVACCLVSRLGQNVKNDAIFISSLNNVGTMIPEMGFQFSATTERYSDSLFHHCPWRTMLLNEYIDHTLPMTVIDRSDGARKRK